MTDDIQIAPTAPAPSPADTATDAAIAAHISGNAEKAAPLFNRARVEHERAAATEAAPRREDEIAPLAPMPDAPTIARSEVDAAIAKLESIGGAHADLVHEWQSTGANVSEEISYAKAAYRSIVANDPELIASVDKAGLGNHPSVLKFLAKQGRLDAGAMGDFTISRNNERNYEPMTINRAGPSGTNKNSPAREELDALMSANPPGSQSYKSPSVQRRVEALTRQISGGGNVIGQGGRTS